VALAFSGAFSAGGAFASALAAGAGGAAGFIALSSCTAHEESAKTIHKKTTPVTVTRLFICAPHN
jgi:hypothetical protein